MRGTVLDLPLVVAHAREQIAAAGLASRCEAVEGDALAAVPPGADAYVLKSLIHGYEDDETVAILRNCRSVMPVHGKVILIERLLPQQIDPGDERARGNFFSDLNMMLLPAGRERTEKEYEGLLAKAELRLNRSISTPGPPAIIEAVPA